SYTCGSATAALLATLSSPAHVGRRGSNVSPIRALATLSSTVASGLTSLASPQKSRYGSRSTISRPLNPPTSCAYSAASPATAAFVTSTQQSSPTPTAASCFSSSATRAPPEIASGDASYADIQSAPSSAFTATRSSSSPAT